MSTPDKPLLPHSALVDLVREHHGLNSRTGTHKLKKMIEQGVEMNPAELGDTSAVGVLVGGYPASLPTPICDAVELLIHNGSCALRGDHPFRTGSSAHRDAVMLNAMTQAESNGFDMRSEFGQNPFHCLVLAGRSMLCATMNITLADHQENSLQTFLKWLGQEQHTNGDTPLQALWRSESEGNDRLAGRPGSANLWETTELMLDCGADLFKPDLQGVSVWQRINQALDLGMIVSEPHHLEALAQIKAMGEQRDLEQSTPNAGNAERSRASRL